MECRRPIWAADGQEQWRKGPWAPQEDKLLVDHVNAFGEGNWNSVSKQTGLRRSGKSCRLRWVNYLRPDLKRGKITPEEETVIMELHAQWGNRWSAIARSLPGRTDNEIKNYWRTHFKKSSRPSKKVAKARAQYLLRLHEEEEEAAKQKEQQYYYEQQQPMLLQHQQQQIMKEMERVALLEQEMFMDCAYDPSFSDHHLLQDFGGGDLFRTGHGLAVVEGFDAYAMDDDDVHQLVRDLMC